MDIGLSESLPLHVNAIDVSNEASTSSCVACFNCAELWHGARGCPAPWRGLRKPGDEDGAREPGVDSY